MASPPQPAVLSPREGGGPWKRRSSEPRPTGLFMCVHCFFFMAVETCGGMFEKESEMNFLSIKIQVPHALGPISMESSTNCLPYSIFILLILLIVLVLLYHSCSTVVQDPGITTYLRSTSPLHRTSFPSILQLASNHSAT